MNADQLIDSFIQILQCVSVEDALVSPDEPLNGLAKHVDLLDFEHAVACFEATHRVSLDYSDLDDKGLESLTIRQIIEEHLVTEGRGLLDPLFVTKRFLQFREAIIDELQRVEEHGEEPNRPDSAQ